MLLRSQGALDYVILRMTFEFCLDPDCGWGNLLQTTKLLVQLTGQNLLCVCVVTNHKPGVQKHVKSFVDQIHHHLHVTYSIPVCQLELARHVRENQNLASLQASNTSFKAKHERVLA